MSANDRPGVGSAGDVSILGATMQDVLGVFGSGQPDRLLLNAGHGYDWLTLDGIQADGLRLMATIGANGAGTNANPATVRTVSLRAGSWIWVGDGQPVTVTVLTGGVPANLWTTQAHYLQSGYRNLRFMVCKGPPPSLGAPAILRPGDLLHEEEDSNTAFAGGSGAAIGAAQSPPPRLPFFAIIRLTQGQTPVQGGWPAELQLDTYHGSSPDVFHRVWPFPGDGVATIIVRLPSGTDRTTNGTFTRFQFNVWNPNPGNPVTPKWHLRYIVGEPGTGDSELYELCKRVTGIATTNQVVRAAFPARRPGNQTGLYGFLHNINGGQNAQLQALCYVPSVQGGPFSPGSFTTLATVPGANASGSLGAEPLIKVITANWVVAPVGGEMVVAAQLI